MRKYRNEPNRYRPVRVVVDVFVFDAVGKSPPTNLPPSHNCGHIHPLQTNKVALADIKRPEIVIAVERQFAVFNSW